MTARSALGLLSQTSRRLLSSDWILAIGILSIGATVFLAPHDLHGQATIRFEATPAVIHPGDTVSVEVFVDRNGLPPIGGGEIGLAFDTSQFTLTGFETPAEVPVPLVPDLFAWNGPPPVGVGGLTGCNLWWDEVDSDGIAMAFAFSSGTSVSSFQLCRFELTSSPTATIGLHSLGEPPVDLNCLWSGSMLVQLSGSVIPTVQTPLEIAVSNVSEPFNFLCESIAGSVELSWTNAQTYDSLEIFRDGVSIATPAGFTTSFVDDQTNLGQTYEYTIVATLFGVGSPPVSCSVTVDLSVPPPTALSCSDGGGVAELSWQLPASAYDAIAVRRNGTVIASLAGDATSFIDDAPPFDVVVAYDVRGSIGGDESSSETCDLTVLAPPTDLFVRGAINTSAGIDLSDAVFLLTALFSGTETLPCDDAADTNDDGLLNVADGIYLLSYLFNDGLPPPPPFDAPGIDPTPDGLGCATSL